MEKPVNTIAPQIGNPAMTNCPVCQQRQFRHQQLLPDLTVGTCTTCGFLISDIKDKKTIDAEFSRINDQAYQQSIGQVRQQQAGEILRQVERYVERKSDWLDIGCSFGYLLVEAKQAGFKVFGIEPDEKAVKIAHKLLGEEVVQQGLMRAETRPDHSADIISMLDVLEHVPVAVLSDFARMIHQKLKPNGLLVIKVPSTEGLYFTLAHRLLPFGRSLLSGVIKRLWQVEYEYPHTVYFNQRTLRRFLENHGYELLAFKYLTEVPNHTAVDRLFVDSTIPSWQALLSVPAFYLINFIERLRNKSDALLVIARRHTVNSAREAPKPR